MQRLLPVLLTLLFPVLATAYPPAPGFNAAGSDAQAIAIADKVMERLGGYEAWDGTRYLTWRFFGGRRHVWDKWTGKIRFEDKDLLVLMNVHDKKGRAWIDGTPVTQADSLDKHLNKAYRSWINDAYWVVMPYKLKDSGVTLQYAGEGQTEAGVPSHILTLTFAGVGVTPQNKYQVWVGKEDSLVHQWSFYPTADTPEPRFVGPWTNWQQYGRIWLSDGRGQRGHSEIAVFDRLPDAVFDSPAHAELMPTKK